MTEEFKAKGEPGFEGKSAYRYRGGSSSIINNLNTLRGNRKSPTRQLNGELSPAYMRALQRAQASEPSVGLLGFFPRQGEQGTPLPNIAGDVVENCIKRSTTPWNAEICSLILGGGLNLPTAALEASSVWGDILEKYTPQNQIAIIDFLGQVNAAVRNLGPVNREALVEMWNKGKVRRQQRIPRMRRQQQM